MLHFHKFIPALFLVVAALSGCSQNDEIGNGNETLDKTSGVVFRLQSNATTITRSAEDSYSHTQGSPDEYAVNNVRVYLYDNGTKHFVKSFELSKLKQSSTDSDGNVIYETEHVQVPQGTFDIFAIANSDQQVREELESNFLAKIDSVTYVQGLIEDIKKGVVMTNRATDNIAVVVAHEKYTTDQIITIKMERVLARLDIAKSAEKFELTNEKNAKYASVNLTGYYIVNNPKYFYNFRHTAVLSDFDVPTWNLNENFGKVADVNGYVIDPYFFKKKINASNFTNADKYYEHFLGDIIPTTFTGWSSFNAVAATPNYKTAYCLENCMMAPAQKNGYSTGVIFKAIFEPNNNIYHLNSEGKLELTSTQPEILYYYNYSFYDSTDALAAGIGTTTSKINEFNTKKFEKSDEGYRCYYNYWIRHLDNNSPTQMGVMEFGIVRNNLYRMLITSIAGLGYDNEQKIPDPDIPDEGETYLKVILNVKPWIVRDQTNIVL